MVDKHTNKYAAKWTQVHSPSPTFDEGEGEDEEDEGKKDGEEEGVSGWEETTPPLKRSHPPRPRQLAPGLQAAPTPLSSP